MWLQDSGQLQEKGRDDILPYTAQLVLQHMSIEYSPRFLSGSSSSGQSSGAESKSGGGWLFPWSSSPTWPCLERVRGLCLKWIPGPCLWRHASPVWSWGSRRVTSLPGSSPLVNLRPHWDLSYSVLPTVPGGKVGSNCRKEF